MAPSKHKSSLAVPGGSTKLSRPSAWDKWQRSISSSSVATGKQSSSQAGSLFDSERSVSTRTSCDETHTQGFKDAFVTRPRARSSSVSASTRPSLNDQRNQPLSSERVSSQTSRSSESQSGTKFRHLGPDDVTLQDEKNPTFAIPHPNRPAGLKGRILPPNEDEDRIGFVDIGASVDTGYRNQPPQFQRNAGTASSPARRVPDHLEHLVTTCVPKPRAENEDPVARNRGKRNITFTKHMVQSAQIGANGFAIFATWWWPRYYYIFLPFITATVALNVVMVFSNIFTTAIRKSFWPEEKFVPASPESLVLLIPCYNETKEELLKSLNSLVGQDDIDQHQRSIMVICDGRVRGPGMEKTTADYLLQDIFTSYSVHEEIKSAYVAWDQQYMDVVVRKGMYQGLPYLCIIKQQNQGKRDGLIVVRSFLYNFNIRDQRPETIFSGRFFAFMARFLLEDAGQQYIDHLIGMDADTEFDRKCIWNLLEESRYPNTVGVCGYVAVDFSAGQWNPWRLYQSAEYTIAQALRRLHQSIVTHKVSCLPGCCQLLKICEETCGPEVLVEKFGYCPGVKDSLLAHIRATASEDRNHVCHMLSARPKAETRQALAAKAITDVPSSWAVFLSQRRRWTLGATSNDLFLTFAPGVQWFERILAAVNVITWVANPFILASVASFIYACLHTPVWIIMAFVSVMLVPIVYYLFIPFWLHDNARDRLQFWLGCFCYVFGGPFINIAVLLYASWNMDSFGWGKTRKVIAEDVSSDEKSSDLTEKVSSSSDEGNQVSADGRREDRQTQLMKEEKNIGL